MYHICIVALGYPAKISQLKQFREAPKLKATDPPPSTNFTTRKPSLVLQKGSKVTELMYSLHHFLCKTADGG